MAVRRKLVRPDTEIETRAYGAVPFVSESAFLEAVLAAAQTQNLAGGVVTVLVERHPTDLEHEMVTTSAIIEWRDRTDAKPQSERGPLVARPEAGLFEPTESPDESDVVEADDGDERVVELEDEDVSAIPEHAR